MKLERRPLVWVLPPNGRSAGAILIEEGHARRWRPDYKADWCGGAINAWHFAPVFEEPPLRLAQNECHPSYADVCVPIASDVDCAGGSGNGPVYVRGPFRLVGPDVYDLDRDNDGIACENG